MLLEAAGQTEEADTLADLAFAHLRYELEEWDADFDGELIELTVLADLAELKSRAEAIFALRAYGPGTTHNFMYWRLGDQVQNARLLLELAFQEKTIETILEGGDEPRHFKYRVAEGFVDAFGPLCEVFLDRELPDLAAKVYAVWSNALTKLGKSRFADLEDDSVDWQEHAWRLCHSAKDDPQKTLQGLETESYERQEFLISLRDWVGLRADLSQSAYVSTKHVMEWVGPTFDGSDLERSSLLTFLERNAAVKRESYPRLADKDIALIAQYGWVWGDKDHAIGMAERVALPDERASLIVRLLWAFDPVPKFDKIKDSDGYFWYGSAVNTLAFER